MTDERHELAVGLKTRHVFLDTEVYRRYGHNLRAKVLQSFLKQIENGVCTLHITDITKEEITRQIEELAAEVAGSVNKSNKALRRWNGRGFRLPPPKAPDDVSVKELAAPVILDFGVSMLMTWKAKTHQATDIPAKDVFDAYFRGDAPFDKSGSKEFPDAFVVAALDRWCQTQNEQMYVITNDQAMLRAVEARKTLIPLKTLDELLEIIVKAQNPQIKQRVEKALTANWSSVEESIRDKITGLGTVYVGSLHDGEIVEHEMAHEQPTLQDFHVISADGDEVEVVVKVKVPVAFDVQYLDTDTGWYDSEEQSYFGAETETANYECEVTLSLYIVIDATDDELTEIDILTRDLYLEEPYDNFK